MYDLSRVCDVKKMNGKLLAKKKCHISIHAQNSMLLAKDKKWEGEAIEQEENISYVLSELNSNARQFEVFREIERKLVAEIEAYRHELDDAKNKYEEFSRE